MGRPINYKKLGGELTQDGEQLLFRAYFTDGSAEEDAYLVKQVGTDKYRLAAASDSDMVEDFALGETAVQGETAIMNVNTNYEITALTETNSPTFSGVDGTYSVTIAGGNPKNGESATADVVIDLDAIDTIAITNGGTYPTDLSGVTLSATVAGEEVEFSATTSATVEKAKKITQHRVYTFEGNAYKYEIGEVADQVAEADLSTE